MDEIYLGDGLYGSFDGESIVLRAPRLGGDDFVSLESNTLRNFERWLAELRQSYPTAGISRYKAGE